VRVLKIVWKNKPNLFIDGITQLFDFNKASFSIGNILEITLEVKNDSLKALLWNENEKHEFSV